MDVTKQQILKPLRDNEYYYISHEGLTKLAQNIDQNDPIKNTQWTNDYTLELPIRMTKEGQGSIPPLSLIEMFKISVNKFGNNPALSSKINNKWETISYQNYYDQCCNFAQACLSLQLTPYRSINIIGFNSAQWFISFFGSIFGYYLPVGIYTTNGPEACQYVASHSDAELIVAENRIQLNKFLQVWDQLPLLKAIVVYNDETISMDSIPINRRNQVYQWKDFMDLGRKYTPDCMENTLSFRMNKQKPGNMCTLVYTSGTTGLPKGVMLSHDNYTWPAQITMSKYKIEPTDKFISYLPLSHVASQIIDLIGTMYAGANIFFATPDALQGKLIETLREIRPTFFFSVPRVWEKIDEKMKAIALSNGFLARSIGSWAKGMGKQGTFAEQHGKSTPLCFGLAKSLVYNNVKKQLGLDKTRFLVFGAAPLSPEIREYFLSLNLFLINGYGMSECAGATALSDPLNFDSFDKDFLKSCGKAIDGTEILIQNPDQDGNGEICYRGRHIFKGYYKNEQATRETLDSEGYLHSGDVGKLDKKGNLSITGRIKELIITAGGENVAPVLIEEEIKNCLSFISNVMVLGDQQKYLSAILTLKYDIDQNGVLTDKLTPETLQVFNILGSSAKNFEEASKDQIILKKIQAGIDQANKNAISNAQQIRKWTLIKGDFTVDGGELTPTLKLKRKVTTQKYQQYIDSMYQEAKL